MTDAPWILLTTLAVIIVHEPISGQRISEIAEECRYSTISFPRSRPWVSNPPMSVSATTVTGFSCSGNDIFREGRSRDGRNNSVQLALREAESTNTTWRYKTVLTYSCDVSKCSDLWYSNFSNYLIGSATFTNLKPNTLYTMVTLSCYYRYNLQRPCTIDYARYLSSKVNISTTPLVPVFNVTVGTTSLTLHFKPNYYSTGSPPHGHEIIVWAMNEGTAPAPFSHYFELSVLQAVVKNLQPGTNYTLYARSSSDWSSSTSTNNHGRWTARAVRTLSVEPGVPTVTTTVRRDTAAIVKLTPAQTNDLIEQCLVSIHPTTGSGATTGTEVVVEVSDNTLFIEGLLPGTEYSYQVAAMNEAGRSNFTVWATLTTTTSVYMAATESSITLRWKTPDTLDNEHIAAYKVIISPLQNIANAITYTLSESHQNAVLGGLHPGGTYQVQLMTETSSSLQPFYSANVTTLSGGASESVESSILGAGVMLVIVLVVCGVSGLVCCIVWRKMRSRKESTIVHRDVETYQHWHRDANVNINAAGGHNYTESPGNITIHSDVQIDSNPAYATATHLGEDGFELRYHSQTEVRDNRGGTGRTGRGLRGSLREESGRVEKQQIKIYEEMEI